MKDGQDPPGGEQVDKEQDFFGEGFGVVVDLSVWFRDERKACWVWVEQARAVRWLAARLARRGLLPARAPVAMLAPRGLLHPADPLALLRPGDTVRVIAVHEELFKDQCSPECSSGQVVGSQNILNADGRQIEGDNDLTDCRNQQMEITNNSHNFNNQLGHVTNDLHNINSQELKVTNNVCSSSNMQVERTVTSEESNLLSSHNRKADKSNSSPDSNESCTDPAPPPEASLLSMKQRALELLEHYQQAALSDVSRLASPRARSRSPLPPAADQPDGPAGEGEARDGRRRRRVRRRPRRPPALALADDAVSQQVCEVNALSHEAASSSSCGGGGGGGVTRNHPSCARALTPRRVRALEPATPPLPAHHTDTDTDDQQASHRYFIAAAVAV